MSAIEIVLIGIGITIFLLGYLLPARKKDIDEEVQLISEDEIKKMIGRELDGVKEQISDIVDETINYAMEKSERSMEKVSNEKIMAVGEYSDTVLNEINKNHKEVVFLYDMLNDKHDNLMTTINEASQAADGIRQTVRDVEITAAQAVRKAEAVQAAADEAVVRIREAEENARDAQADAENAMSRMSETVRGRRGNLLQLSDNRAYREDRYRDAQEEIVEEAGTEYPDDEYKDRGVDSREVYEDREGYTRNLYGDGGGYSRNVYEDRGRESRGVYEDSRNVYERNVLPEDGFVKEQPVDSGRLFGGEWIENAAREKMADGNEAAEPVEFTPISPKRVEIIHQPDGDYVADDISTSAAFAEMGIFGRMDEAPSDRGGRSGRRLDRKNPFPEESPSLDIRFAQGKDNSRNSNERILELHKAGKSNMAIAKELGLGIGEVKLVIDLFEGM